MTQDEYNELKASVEAVTVQDVHLGRVLYTFLAHLADLAGLKTMPPEPVAPAEVAAEEPSV